MCSARNFSDIAAKIREIGGYPFPILDKGRRDHPGDRSDTRRVLAQELRHRRRGCEGKPAKYVGKGLSDDRIFAAVENLASAGIMGMRLYFMIGLPGEDDGDILAIPESPLNSRGYGKLDPKPFSGVGGSD